MFEQSELRFTETHEWVFVKGETIVVGLTDYGQHLLSSVTNVELPEPDDHHYEVNEDMSSIESLRTSIDLHAPVSGVIVGINTDLLSTPELVNSDPYGNGWVVAMKPDRMADVDDLLSVDEYDSRVPDFEE